MTKLGIKAKRDLTTKKGRVINQTIVLDLTFIEDEKASELLESGSIEGVIEHLKTYEHLGPQYRTEPVWEESDMDSDDETVVVDRVILPSDSDWTEALKQSRLAFPPEKFAVFKSRAEWEVLGDKISGLEEDEFDVSLEDLASNA